ncbi:hypothetical protein [Nocardioides sp.]|jgi:hypothetical protein|uniref:hypothetical protein n=1 Tax=Nocardioides sp. TaxID=35761 RepID=UPI002607CBCB|nr:hypothetical protein [Nocardioides sp.]
MQTNDTLFWDDPDGEYGMDANGRLTQLTQVGDVPVLIHYDDIPESDIQTLHGLRVTTPLRTTIDLAAELPTDQLENLLDFFLDKGSFTTDQALERIAQPDMSMRRGAHVLQALIVRRRLGGRPK